MEVPRLTDEESFLIAFLRGRDVPCPLCGYNLRDLTRAECPECRQALVPAVDVRRLHFGWFLLAVAPGIFSGIAAVLLLIPIVLMTIESGTRPPWPILVVDAFGWASGISALWLVAHRFAFLRQAPRLQRTWAVAAWAIHVGAFALFVGFGWYFGM